MNVSPFSRVDKCVCIYILIYLCIEIHELDWKELFFIYVTNGSIDRYKINVDTKHTDTLTNTKAFSE